MSTDEGEISSVLRALADPTRRRVVEILSEAPHPPQVEFLGESAERRLGVDADLDAR